MVSWMCGITLKKAGNCIEYYSNRKRFHKNNISKIFEKFRFLSTITGKKNSRSCGNLNAFKKAKTNHCFDVNIPSISSNIHKLIDFVPFEARKQPKRHKSALL